jgi:hypothetical protein
MVGNAPTLNIVLTMPGTIGVMPIAHYPATADIRDDNFRSYYTHDEERAEPGYYKVRHVLHVYKGNH